MDGSNTTNQIPTKKATADVDQGRAKAISAGIRQHIIARTKSAVLPLKLPAI
jgi:hypothetical protein